LERREFEIVSHQEKIGAMGWVGPEWFAEGFLVFVGAANQERTEYGVVSTVMLFNKEGWSVKKHSGWERLSTADVTFDAAVNGHTS
jgi:hypothetical protein